MQKKKTVVITLYELKLISRLVSVQYQCLYPNRLGLGLFPYIALKSTLHSIGNKVHIYCIYYF